MAQNNVLSNTKINQAAGGNEMLREVLRDLTITQKLTSTATNTATGKPIPPQAKASVSYLQQNYVVQIQNPGSVSPSSALQKAQATANATASTNLAPVRAIYHQIRYATSPSFSVNDNATVLGGDTGSTQTYWTLTGLGTGKFYFQIRSSYDGTNWNLWRNANGGQAITKGVEGVTQEQGDNSVWGVFTLSGDELVAFGSGFARSGDTFGVPSNFYTSALQAITGPNGFTQTTGNLSHGVRNNSIVIATPTDTSGTIGPPDYPTLVTETYEDGEGNVWPGSANIFGFAYDPLGSNVNVYSNDTGTWVVFTLPGGAQMAIGTGTVATGTKLVIPPQMAGWFTPGQMLSIVTSQNAFSGDNHAHGINQANIADDLTVTATWEDGEGHVWGITANWFAVALSPGLPLTAVPGGKFFTFGLPTGGKVSIGAGVTPSGSYFTLPAGFTKVTQTLSIGVPVSFNDTGHASAGVAHCSIQPDPVNQQMIAALAYQDGAENFWDGNVGWMCFAWE